MSEEEKLARLFHEKYEKLALEFKYETREETREFDPSSPNGKLMIEVCREILVEKHVHQYSLISYEHLKDKNFRSIYDCVGACFGCGDVVLVSSPVMKRLPS